MPSRTRLHDWSLVRGATATDNTGIGWWLQHSGVCGCGCGRGGGCGSGCGCGCDYG